MHPLRVYSHGPLPLPNATPTGLQSQTFLGLKLLVRDPQSGMPDVGIRSLTAIVIILPLVDQLPRVWVLIIPCLCTSYLFHCGSLFIYPAVDLFASLQVIAIDSCSVNSCHFDIHMGGGELRVFLLCHLGHSPTCILLPTNHTHFTHFRCLINIFLYYRYL